MMVLRVIGVLALVVGLAAFVLSCYGLFEGPDFSRNLASWWKTQGVFLDSSHFQFRWMIAMAIYGGTGIVLGGGGVALLLGRRWGLLVISVVAIVTSVYPWILQVLGLTRYGFESAGAGDTVALIAVASAAAAIYVWSRGRVVA